MHAPANQTGLATDGFPVPFIKGIEILLAQYEISDSIYRRAY